MFLFLVMSSMRTAVPNDLQVLEMWKTIHLSFDHLNLWILWVSIFKRVVARCTATGNVFTLKESCNLSEAQRLNTSFAAFFACFSQVTFIASPTMPQRHCGHPEDPEGAATR